MVVLLEMQLVQLLSRIYIENDGHLDAYEFAKRIIPLITDESRWIPEFGKKAPLLERLFYPEKWLFIRLHLVNNKPRQCTVGNVWYIY